MQKRILLPIIGAALIGGAAVGVGFTAFADSNISGTVVTPATRPAQGFGAGVSGTVTAINGSTLTVSGANGATYTIDASGATIDKYENGSSTSVGVSGIAIGDTISVSGQIETATISAKEIRDGNPPKPTPPVAIGKVTAISGTTITLSGMNMPFTRGAATSTTYTVDASNATITELSAPTGGGKPTPTTISVSQIAVGDMLIVEGTANGTDITASSITDGMGLRGKGWFGPGRMQPQSGS